LFEAEVMGRREETRGIDEALGIAKRAVMGTRLELLLEVATASFQGQRADIATVDLKEVEDPDRQWRVSQAAMQRAEIRQAPAIHRDQLAVEDRSAGIDRGKRGSDRGKSRGEVVPVATQQAHPRAHLVELQTPAVELDLMRPAGAAGWRGPLG
jgi:hypothetical protein